MKTLIIERNNWRKINKQQTFFTWYGFNRFIIILLLYCITKLLVKNYIQKTRLKSILGSEGMLQMANKLAYPEL